MGQEIKGVLAWCKMDDDHTYSGHRACTNAEYEEYLERWKWCMGLEELYTKEMREKGIEKYPVFLKR